MEDLTDPELIRQKEKCDRHVSLYGYVRGTPLKLGGSVHLAGESQKFRKSVVALFNI